jgi:conjugal transfer pilus assembly protein TraI
MLLKRTHPQALFEQIGNSVFQQLLTSSGAGEERFRQQYLPTIEKLALTVQALPLERDLFDDPGGALRFGLMSGLTTLRLCAGVIFAPSSTAEQRRILEPQYRWAAFVATLASVPIICAHNVTVTVDGEPWTMAARQSTLWEATEQSGEYEVTWASPKPTKPSTALGIVLLSRFFRPGMFASMDPATLLAMCEGINACGFQSPTESALAKVVRTAQEKVRDIEKQRRSLFFEPPSRIAQNQGAAPQHAIKQPDSDAGTDSDDPIQNADAPADTAAADASSMGATTDMEGVLEKGAMPIQIEQWARAISSALPAEINFVDEGVLITKKALNFGLSSKKMYAMIYEAGLVVSKSNDSFIGNAALAELFRKEQR